MDKEDVFAYIYSKSGLSNRTLNTLCKLTGRFELIQFLQKEDVYGLIDEKYLYKLLSLNDDISCDYMSYEKSARIFYSDLKVKKIKWTHLTCPDYPKRLKTLEDPPSLLFYIGELPDENVPTVSIIGARECSEYGKKMACTFSKELSMEGVQIISGMARGIDGIAQKTCADAGGRTFAVLGSGTDVIYPPENKDIYSKIIVKGGILSELYPGTQPEKKFFPARNRIISGLSDIVLVIEARKKSGTLITVSQALEQGREVFAVPGRVCDGLSYGCNELIANGAGVAMSTERILEAIGRERQYTFNDYSVNYRLDFRDSIQKDIVNLLRQQTMNVDELYEIMRDGIDYSDLIEKLMEMQLLDLIYKSGNNYVLRGEYI